MSRFSCIFLVSVIFATGCAKTETDMLSRSTTADCVTCESEALLSGQFVESEWPHKEWWQDFDDSNLNRLIQIALETSPSLKTAEERLKRATETAKAQRGYLFPEIDLTGGTNWQHFGKNSFFRSLGPDVVPPVLNQIDLDLNFIYEFDFWGKNRALYQAALDEALSIKAERDQSILILTTSITYAYFQHQRAAKKLELLKKIGQNHEKLVNLTQGRYDHALDFAVQENSSQQADLEASKSIIQTEEELLLIEQRIKAMIGVGQDGELAISPPSISNHNHKTPLPSHLSLDLLARRPDLEAQLWLVEKSAEEIHVAKTAFYPDINLMAFVGLESLHFNNFFSRQSIMSSLNPAFHLPIFTAGRLRAQLRERSAAFNEAIQVYNNLVLQAAQEVAMQLTQITKIQQQVDLQNKIVETTAYNTQIAQARFTHALDPLSIFLNRQNEQFLEEITLAELTYARRLASVLLIRALGGGFFYE